MTPEQLAASNTEHGNQVALFAWAAQQCYMWRECAAINEQARSQAKELEDLTQQLSLMFAIPNGGLRHKAEANKLKAEGVKSGVPDIFLPVAVRSKNSLGHYDEGYWHGLFIEMKKPSVRPKHLACMGGVSARQDEWHNDLRAQGYQVAVCYSWQEARDVILQYLGVS